MINNGDRKNDIRQIIPTLKAGDVITESVMAAIIQACNDRRPFSNPPRQIIQPVAGVGKEINFASWCVIDLANPTVNGSLNATSVTATSDTNNSFDGTTAAKKMIFNFEKGVSIAASKKAQVFFGKATTGPTTAASLTGNTNVAPATTPSVTCVVRIRPITASFVTASQTWNNFGSLTLGSSSTFTAASLLIGIPSGTNIAFSSASAAGLTNLNLDAVFTGAITAYGFVVDVEPTLTNFTGATISSISASTVIATNQITPRLIAS